MNVWFLRYFSVSSRAKEHRCNIAETAENKLTSDGKINNYLIPSLSRTKNQPIGELLCSSRSVMEVNYPHHLRSKPDLHALDYQIAWDNVFRNSKKPACTNQSSGSKENLPEKIGSETDRELSCMYKRSSGKFLIYRAEQTFLTLHIMI